MNSSEKDCRATAEISKENGFFTVFRGSRAPQGWEAKARATPLASGAKEFIALQDPSERPSPSGPKPPRLPRKPSRSFPPLVIGRDSRRGSGRHRGDAPRCCRDRQSPGFRNPCQSQRRRGRVTGARAAGPQERPRGIVGPGWAAGRRATDALPPLPPGWGFATSACAARRTGSTPQRATSRAPRAFSRFQTD